MQAVRVEVGVDWFAMSMIRGKDNANEWYCEMQELIERVASEGNEAQDRCLLGYVGISSGNCFVGEREGDYFAQLTGNYAQRYWKDCYRVGGHVSRVDIQCTAFIAGDTTNYGANVYEDAYNSAQSIKGNRKRGVRRNEDNEGGYSVYIGARSSDHYCCIYNKGAESKNPAYAGAWRYELRFKNDLATTLSNDLFCRQNGEDGAILETIRRWCDERGVICPWAARSEVPLTYTSIAPKSDRDTALWWLATQVRPALEKARRLGYYGQAIQALGVEGLDKH